MSPIVVPSATVTAGLTLADLRALVKQALGGRTGGSLTDLWYDTRIHGGYVRLCTFQGIVTRPGRVQPQYRLLRFFELEDRTSRTLATTLTSNFVTPFTTLAVCTVLNIYDRTNNRPLFLTSRRGMLRLDPDAVGRPSRWVPVGQGGVIGYHIDKRPGVVGDQIDVYEYSYTYPAPLVSDGTYPLIPPAWHEAIWLAAAAEGARLLDMPEKADEFETRFLAYIAERKSPHEEASYATGSPRRTTRIGPSY